MINTDNDLYYLKRTLQLARQGLYSTMPNPRVGCVIVKDNHIISSGWHKYAGEAHAEIVALNKINYQAHGATAYISLEPCCHSGKTPPCTNALIRSGIKRVVIAANDPNPLVSGKSIATLKKANIEVISDLLPKQAQKLNPGFYKRMMQHMPYVRCKLATSLDGRIAAMDNTSKWLSGTTSRQDVHKWRAQSCAIITGINTVLADDPALTVRVNELKPHKSWAKHKQPKRIILDSNLKIPLSAKILTSDKVIIVTTDISSDTNYQHKKQILVEQGHELIELDATDKGRIPLKKLLTLLATRQYNEILIESGGTLAGYALEQQLIDELIIYITPKLLGHLAKPMLHLPIHSMTDIVQLGQLNTKKFDPDLRITVKTL